MVKNVAWSPQSVWLFFKLLLSSSFCSSQYFSYSSNSRQINTYIIKQISRIHKHATYTEEIFGSRANERKAKELHIDVYLYESSRLINFWRNFSENATHTKLKRTRIHLIYGSHLLYWIIVYLHYQHLTLAILRFLTCVVCAWVCVLFVHLFQFLSLLLTFWRCHFCSSKRDETSKNGNWSDSANRIHINSKFQRIWIVFVIGNTCVFFGVGLGYCSY